MSDDPKFMSASAAARELGLPLSHLLRCVENGRLPATRAGTFPNSPILISRADVERLRRDAPDILPHNPIPYDNHPTAHPHPHGR